MPKSDRLRFFSASDLFEKLFFEQQHLKTTITEVIVATFASKVKNTLQSVRGYAHRLEFMLIFARILMTWRSKYEKSG